MIQIVFKMQLWCILLKVIIEKKSLPNNFYITPILHDIVAYTSKNFSLNNSSFLSAWKSHGKSFYDEADRNFSPNAVEGFLSREI